ncbi:MAG: C40 family peptidase [Peptostreptococcaceae bacterium]|nr:C40 family peptidase [Peptostreptococcaceae bacterium]
MDKKRMVAGIVAVKLLLPAGIYAQDVNEVFTGLDYFMDYAQTSDLLSDTAQVASYKGNATAMSFSPAPEKVSGLDPFRALVSQHAYAQLGKTYRYGAYGPDRFDCSGLIYYVFDLAGKKVPRTSQAQSEAGVSVDKKDLKVGDIVFFDTRHTGNLNDIKIDTDDTLSLFAGEGPADKQGAFAPSKVTHSGIYIGDGRFIHASSGSVMKVVVEELDSKYFSQRYLFARRYE